MPIETIDLTSQGAVQARRHRSDEDSPGSHVIFSGIYKILLTEQQVKELRGGLDGDNDSNGDK